MRITLHRAIRHPLAAGIGVLWAVASHATVVQIDQFVVVKNGATLFNDSFSNNLTPSQESPVYSVTGSFAAGAESAGRLTLDSAWGDVTANAAGEPRRTLGAQYASNVNPAFPSSGLTRADSIDVQATFDLVMPSGPLVNGYGIQLQGIVFGQGQTQTLELAVQYNAALGGEVIRLLLQDFSDASITTLGFVPLVPGAADQVQLRLTRQDSASADIFGSFAFGRGGQFDPFSSIGRSDAVFSHTDFARARMIAFAEIPEPASAASLLAGLLVLAVLRRGAC